MTRITSATIASALALGAAAALLPLPAAAQEKLPDTIVTADRVEVPASEVNASVTVITREEIQRRQWRTLADALRDVSGVAINRSGGPGKTTQVFTRGFNPNQTLVIIDGVRAGDPSQQNGATDFAHLLAADIDRIEIVRGPMSTLYGSDAMGGVINVITAKGRGPTRWGAYAEGGTHFTGTAAASVQGAMDRFNYNVSIAGYGTKGDTVVPRIYRAPGSKEDDPYANLSWRSRLGWDVNDTIQLSWFSRGILARNQYDAFDAFTSLPSEDPNARERTRQFFNRVQADVTPPGSIWKSTVGLAYSDIKRRDLDEPDAFNPFPFAMNTASRGRRLQFDWKNDFQPLPNMNVLLGVDLDQSWFKTSTDGVSGNGNALIVGPYINGRYALFDRVYLTLGGRLDYHDQFGIQPTGRAGLAYLHRETGTKIKGSVGNAFRAPALFELFGVAAFCAGNPDLEPEKSWGWEFGAEQALLGGKLNLGATYFHNRIRNLITCLPPFIESENVQNARTRGVETNLTWQAFDNFGIKLGYTFTDARDLDTGERLIRRPKHTFFASADWLILDGWTVGAEWVHNAGRRDFSVTTFQNFTPDSYSVVRLTTAYQFNENFTIFGRVENLFDVHYQEADGFKSPHIGVFAGFRIRY